MPLSPPISPKGASVVVVVALRSQAATTLGMTGGVEVEITLDLGSSVLLIQRTVKAKGVIRLDNVRPLQLIMPSGEDMPIVEQVIRLGELGLMHKFVVVENLACPAIVGMDFLQEYGLVLDFTSPIGRGPPCSHKFVP